MPKKFRKNTVFPVEICCAGKKMGVREKREEVGQLMERCNLRFIQKLTTKTY